MAYDDDDERPTRRESDRQLEKLKEHLSGLTLKVSNLETKAAHCCDDRVKEHDQDLRNLSGFKTSSEIAISSFKDFVKDQTELNKKHGDLLQGTVTFQLRLLTGLAVIGAIFVFFGGDIISMLVNWYGAKKGIGG